MARNNQRGQNNNPEGRNQYSGGWRESAKERPMATAAAAAAAVGAGVFLWSRRNQISEQLGNISDQIGEWSQNMNSSGSNREFETSGADTGFSASSGTSSTRGMSSGSGGGKSQSELAEEALTLKETGKKSNRSADSTMQDQSKSGSIAY